MASCIGTLYWFHLKTWPNARNISTQHIPTLLGRTYVVYVSPPYWDIFATCWMMLDQIWKRSNFSCNILSVAWYCICLATFVQHCCTRACALGSLVARWGTLASTCGVENVEKLRAFGQPVQHKSCRDNVVRYCVGMLWAFGQALIRWYDLVNCILCTLFIIYLYSYTCSSNNVFCKSQPGIEHYSFLYLFSLLYSCNHCSPRLAFANCEQCILSM